MAKTIWVIAGESSGDMYGERIIANLKKLDPTLNIKFMGGPLMQKCDAEMMVDSTELGVMGFVEVMKLYPTFKRIFNGLVKRATEERPDAVVMIDYPGFNVRLAKKLYAQNIPVVYYVCPQVWAWGKKRIPLLKKIISRMIVIFPFEVEFWKKHGVKTTFAGHPLIEILGEEKINEERDENLIALLPGSRGSEISRLLQPMLDTALRLAEEDKKWQFILPAPRESSAAMITEMLNKLPPEMLPRFRVEVGNSVYWMQKATAGLAASGTVTVQAAILGLPLISVYRLNPITFFMAKRLVKLPYFTMVNIIGEKEVYREFCQEKVNADILFPELKQILPGGERREIALQGVAEVIAKLGGDQANSTMLRTAEAIIEVADKKV